MGLFKDINDRINELLCASDIISRQEQEKKLEMVRREHARQEKIARVKRHKIGKEVRKKEWHNVKDEIYSRYSLPIADDAKKIARDLLNNKILSFEKDLDTVSVFFITDERVVMNRYIEGGYKAIDEYAKNLIRHAFIGGPITSTLLRRLKILEDAKIDGRVIDTEIDIDGFPPHGKIMYAIEEIELDGQVIPARRKFSIRCEMTATLTEGFRTGPFVSYDKLYLSAKEEMEQVTDEEIETTANNKDIKNKDIKNKDKRNKDTKNKDDNDASKGREYGKIYKIKVCPHGTDKTLYCSKCDGDIIVSPSKKKVIGICMDTSGSMSGDKLSGAKIAVINILERIPISDNIQVVLIVFDSDLEMSLDDIIPFGTKYTGLIRSSAISRIKNILPGGSTPLYDAINYFLDGIWSGAESFGESHGETHFLIDESRIFFPYTYLIMVSDGEENQSSLKNIIYKGRTGKDAFFAKLGSYRDAGLITDIIPLAYGEGESNETLIRELKKISGKNSINEASPENILESLKRSVDSILCGEDNLKMMGLSMDGKDND